MSKSSKKPRPQKETKTMGKVEERPSNSSSFIDSKYLIFMVGGILAIAYFLLSFSSNGFYQDDEAAHYISMRNFWHDPYTALGNWAKIGYKLIYAVPSLFGVKAVTFFNCFLAACSSVLAYKTAKLYGSKYAWLAFGLLALQPIWLQLCYRNYSEILTSFLLILFVYLHKTERIALAAFVLAYTCIIREELYPLLALFGLVLLYNKNFKAIALASIPPLAYNFFGMSQSGDPLYMVNAILSTSGSYAKEYPRQGFDWYPILSEKIFGIVAILLSLGYIAMSFINKKLPSLYLVVPAVMFYFFHCVFNWQSLDFGPSTGGNHRYLLTISPLIATMAALGVDEIQQSTSRYKALYFIVPILLITFLFWTFELDGIRLSDKRMWLPLGIGFLTSLLLLFPIKNVALYSIGFLSLALIEDLKIVKPYKKTPENAVMEKIAKWYNTEINRKSSEITQKARVHSDHLLFNYYLGRTGMDFENQQRSVTKESMDSSKVGDIIIWESHYSYRPNLRPTSLPLEFFTSRPYEYKLVNEYLSTDNRFMAKIFIKSAKNDENYEKGLLLMKEKKYNEAQILFENSIKSNPKNAGSLTQLALIFQQKQDYNNTIGYLNNALAVDPNFGEALLNRGSLYSANKRYEEAIIDLSKYIAQNPRDANGYLNRGSCYLYKGDYTNGINDFNALTQLAPDYGNGYLQLGLCYLKSGNIQSACQSLNTAKSKGVNEAESLIAQNCK